MLAIRYAMNRLGVQVSELAEAVGVERSAISRLLNHGRVPVRVNKEEVIEKGRVLFKTLGEEEYHALWEEIREENTEAIESRYREKIKEEVVMISAMTREKFGFKGDPFVEDVRSEEDVYISSEHRYVKQSMWQAAVYGGFLAVVGESGSGKSTLRRALIAELSKKGVPVIMIQPKTIDKRRLTAQGICEAILEDVAPSVKGKRSLEGKARQIEKVLTHSSRSGKKHVLIIEEAHDLAVQTLKYLKRFWEMEDGFTKLLSIIVIGQPEMRYQLDEGRNYDAREVIRRIEVAQLRPLDRVGDIEKYFELKFDRVGVKWSDIAEKDVGDAMREVLLRQSVNAKTYSLAYPLTLNNVCKKALNVASEVGASKIDAGIIKSL